VRLVKLGIQDLTIDLHPRLSVLTGLDAAARHALTTAVRELPRGHAVAGGVVEAHDVLFDLSDEVLDLFELRAPEIDPVVTAADVRDRSPEGSEEPASEPEPEPDPEGAGSVDDQVLEARAADLEEQLAVLDAPDGSALAAAVEALEAASTPTTSPEAEAVLEQLLALEEREQALDAAETGPGVARLVAARDRVEAARAELLAARRAAGPRLDPELVAELEAAHHELVEATEMLDGRFGKRRAQSRVEEARAREDAALRALGLVSYTDYHLGVLHRQPGVGHASRLEAAEEDLALAEADLAALEAEGEAGAEVEVARAELDRERERLLERVAAILGHEPGPDPVADLRAHRVGGPAHDTARQALAAELVAVGVALDAGDGAAALTDEELVTLARAWLHEADLARVHAGEAADGLAHLREGGEPPQVPPPPQVDVDPTGEGDRRQLVEDLEWYLLGRLASQRSVSYVGSVPMLVDGVLDGLPPGAAVEVLERLEPVSESVQLVVVTDDPAVVAWAEGRDATEVALVTAGRRP
jgi:hypothetical protein